jgi:hypothetical protein
VALQVARLGVARLAQLAVQVAQLAARLARRLGVALQVARLAQLAVQVARLAAPRAIRLRFVRARTARFPARSAAGP